MPMRAAAPPGAIETAISSSVFTQVARTVRDSGLLQPESQNRRGGGAGSNEQVAPKAGFEPATRRLTAGCSTTELLRKSQR